MFPDHVSVLLSRSLTKLRNVTMFRRSVTTHDLISCSLLPLESTDSGSAAGLHRQCLCVGSLVSGFWFFPPHFNLCRSPGPQHAWVACWWRHCTVRSHLKNEFSFFILVVALFGTFHNACLYLSFNVTVSVGWETLTCCHRLTSDNDRRCCRWADEHYGNNSKNSRSVCCHSNTMASRYFN